MNIFLFLSVSFLFVYFLGKILERFHVPWVFSALILGVLFSLYAPADEIIQSETFSFLGKLGMYFLLFIIGFETNVRKLRNQTGIIVKSAFFIILFEGLLGTAVLMFLFSLPWHHAFLIALSFATVGEAVLAPVLDKLKIVNTKLGQAIIGIGSLDDIIEIILLFVVTLSVGSGMKDEIHVIVFSLVFLFLLTILFTKLKETGEQFRFLNIETLFFFVVAIFFLFIGIGEIAGAAPLAALLAGVSVRTFIPKPRCALIEREVRAMAYGLFAPIFFIWIGNDLNIQYLRDSFFPFAAIVIVSALAKIIGSMAATRRQLGMRQSFLLGIGLSVRFSVSIVIIKIFYDYGLISQELYSLIVASSVVFTLFIPFIFSYYLYRWKQHI